MTSWLTDACCVLAGLLFGAGTLCYVDAFATASVDFPMHLPGIFSLLGLVMLNAVTWEAVSGEYSNPFVTDGSSSVARAWVFCALCFSFGGLLSSLWLLSADASSTQQQLAWQNGLLFVSSLLFRAARTRSGDDDS